jgi:regulator of protease activity HflC (stomatin/prohibitin superfamily)
MNQEVATSATGPTQLAQVRVPLEQAGAVFEERDASGRTPVVLVPLRDLRIRLDFLALAIGLLGLGSLSLALQWHALVSVLAYATAAALATVGLMSAFFVRVPEGTTALLISGGRHHGALLPGPHMVPPWIVVSHVVTRRQVPFAVPRIDAPTQDNVSASIEVLATFSIAEPARFVYSIAVSDFDLVLQAACCQAARTLIRGETWSSILDLSSAQAANLRAVIDAEMRTYGVQIEHLSITYARPEPAFLQAEGARQLAVAQRAEQVERQTLAEHRQHDSDALVELRLSHLEDVLQRYPAAANWEWQAAQLEVARALANNGRAVVQVGRPADVLNALLMHTIGDPPAAPVNANHGQQGSAQAYAERS